MFLSNVVVVVFPPISVRNQLLMKAPVRGRARFRFGLIAAVSIDPDRTLRPPPLERTQARCGRRASAPSRRADLVRTLVSPRACPVCAPPRGAGKNLPLEPRPPACVIAAPPHLLSLARPPRCASRAGTHLPAVNSCAPPGPGVLPIRAQREAVASGDAMLVERHKEVSAGVVGHQRSRIVTAVQQPWIRRGLRFEAIARKKFATHSGRHCSSSRAMHVRYRQIRVSLCRARLWAQA